MPALLQRAKVRTAALLCHPLVGRAVRAGFGPEIPNRGCRFDTREAPIGDSEVAAIAWGFYEAAERRFVDRHLGPDLDVVELGSSLGVVTAHIARRLAAGIPSGRRKLVCVEANPALLPTLRRNLALNGPGLDVRVENYAVSYAPGDVELALGDQVVDSRVGSGATRTVRVPGTTLSDVLARNGIGEYAAVMDIEGAELGVVLNDGDALARCRKLVIELHRAEHDGRTWQIEEVRRLFMDEVGFREIDRHGRVSVFARDAA